MEEAFLLNLVINRYKNIIGEWRLMTSYKSDCRAKGLMIKERTDEGIKRVVLSHMMTMSSENVLVRCQNQIA
jgi:hypothetical protein